MKRKRGKRLLLILVSLVVVCGLSACGGISEGDFNEESLDELIGWTSIPLLQQSDVVDVAPGSGDWLALDLAKCETVKIPENYLEDYVDNVRLKVKDGNGKLDVEHPTDYARTALGLYAAGADPTNIEGYDLLKYLDQKKSIREQGINAEMYALILAGYDGYPLKNEKSYLKDILSQANEDGGIGYDGQESDVDMTAMMVQALSPYVMENKDAKTLMKAALSYLSQEQNQSGGYDSCESVAQVIIALNCAGLDPLKEEAFQKDGKNLGDGLIQFKTEDGFCHELDGETDGMATEQALRAMAALHQASLGKSLYRK